MTRLIIGGQESVSFPVHTGVGRECVLAPILCIFLLCVTQLLHKEPEYNSGVAVDYRLDRNLFKIRRLQATTKLSREWFVRLQYTDDYALVTHSPQDLQSILTVAVKAYSRMGLSANITKTEVVCQ